MNIQSYILKKERDLQNSPQYRVLCTRCAQPQFGCYCSEIKSFDPHVSFVILIHPIEVKRRIATGRMSHLCLQNSYLIKGQNYTNNDQVNSLLQDPEYESILLYPGINSKNLSTIDATERSKLAPSGKKLRIIVIDGTWATARKMIAQSQNLKNLARICFTPIKPSNFRVRKQPQAHFYSTIEAIHHTIELLAEAQGFSLQQGRHDNLIHVFNSMVEKQLHFIRESNLNPRPRTYRREGQRKSA